MRAAAAGLLSTAVLLSSGCDRRPDPKDKGDTVRRAVYRSLVARDLLMSCERASRQVATRTQDARFAELKQFAARKGAGQSLWLGENDWNAVAPLADREACGAGDAAYAAALAGYRERLDGLADAVADYRE